jgi:pilus assembly protein Flp/PilA
MYLDHVGSRFAIKRWLRCPQPFILKKEILLMLKFYVKASDLLERLRSDQDGTVSWEYILVAALVIVAVGTAFGPGATGAVEVALANGIGTIVASFTGFL